MHHHKPALRLVPGLRGLAVLASVLACAAGGLATGPAAQAASQASSAIGQPGWTKASGTGGSVLRGVSADSATDAWAVGCKSTSTGIGPPLTLRWNGQRWTKVPSPNPGANGGHACLDSVSAVSATDAWAAGYVIGSTGITHTVILHWNGKSWKQVTSPSPGGIYNVLWGVSAASATDVWAVGSYAVSTTSPGYSLILHWNGKSWTKVASPSPCQGCAPDIALRGVSAVSATDAWAVGYNTGGQAAQPLILHWNGKDWKQVTSPSPGATISTYLLGVAATSAADGWAVGYYHTGGLNALPFLLRWNGTSWTKVPSPSPGGTAGSTGPDAVSALSPASAWTVGSHSTSGIGVHSKTLALHWNGTRWTQVPSPSAGGTTSTYLLGVAATSPADAWAVGYDGQSVILHWNGKSWTKVTSPN